MIDSKYWFGYIDPYEMTYRNADEAVVSAITHWNRESDCPVKFCEINQIKQFSREFVKENSFITVGILLAYITQEL